MENTERAKLKKKLVEKYKSGVKRELNELVISYKTLFTGLDRLCKSINFEKFRHSD